MSADTELYLIIDESGTWVTCPSCGAPVAGLAEPIKRGYFHSPERSGYCLSCEHRVQSDGTYDIDRRWRIIYSGDESA